jgi:hypothetical protein
MEGIKNGKTVVLNPLDGNSANLIDKIQNSIPIENPITAFEMPMDIKSE